MVSCYKVVRDVVTYTYSQVALRFVFSYIREGTLPQDLAVLICKSLFLSSWDFHNGSGLVCPECSNLVTCHLWNLPNRSGIFLQSELEDFELFLLRLNRIGGVMQDTLPVQNYRSKEGWDFHSHFILYCLEHSLQYLLYVYLDRYKWVLRIDLSLSSTNQFPLSILLLNVTFRKILNTPLRNTDLFEIVPLHSNTWYLSSVLHSANCLSCVFWWC